MRELSVAIVSYNAREELSACLESIYGGVHPDLEVIVADNASTDGSASMVRDRFPQADLVTLESNVGFSRANNVCWRRAESDLIVFLNADTIVPQGAFERMLVLMRTRTELGALGPLLRNDDGSVQMSFGSMLSPTSELGQKIVNAGYRNGAGPLRRYVERRHARERTVDWVSGACLVTRRSLLETIDGFDEAFFLYSEDVDLCARIRKTGAKILFTPQIEITHLKGRSMSKVRDRAFYESQRSRLHFYAKHYGQPRFGLLKLYMTVRLGLAYLFHPSARAAYRKTLRLLVGDST